MTTTAPAAGGIETRMAEVRSDIARADTKASILLAALAIVAGPLADHVGDLVHRGWATGIPAVSTAALVGGGAWLLLDVVRPRLAGGRAYFVHYARCSDEELEAALAQPELRAELRNISRICHAKMRLLTGAVLLLKAAGLVALLTAALAIGGV
ncbi:Pycsar system effector family protein [Streptomyces sp. NPDC059788]|uniref:Pycsar system effector family protein n=1 Tax=Streptomyces sp. NPDC059788 TaxID=3346948 RepID=UPI003647A812